MNEQNFWFNPENSDKKLEYSIKLYSNKLNHCNYLPTCTTGHVLNDDTILSSYWRPIPWPPVGKTNAINCINTNIWWIYKYKTQLQMAQPTTTQKYYDFSNCVALDDAHMQGAIYNKCLLATFIGFGKN